MGEQLDWVRTHSHRADPQTSRTAAKRVESKASAHKAQVLAALRKYGPLTSEEAAGHVGIAPIAAAKRLSDLKNEGRIVPRGTGTNSRGNAVTRWGLAPR